MPANPNAPFGFAFVGIIGGAPVNFGIHEGRISRSNVHKIFRGDVLLPRSGGYYDLAPVTPGGGPIGGIALDFSWSSDSNGHRVWRPNWPGSADALGDISVKVIDHPQAVFEVQALLGPITDANLGLNANFNIGSGGNLSTGKSSFTLDDGTMSTAPSLPFKIYEMDNATNPLVRLPGFDNTVPHNKVRVIFNNLVVG